MTQGKPSSDSNEPKVRVTRMPADLIRRGEDVFDAMMRWSQEAREGHPGWSELFPNNASEAPVVDLEAPKHPRRGIER